jgi:hypothetical protein
VNGGLDDFKVVAVEENTKEYDFDNGATAIGSMSLGPLDGLHGKTE